MKEPAFEVGQKVRYKQDKQLYQVEHVTQTAGTPSERFYVIRLLGRYGWMSSFGSPAITHTLPESYAIQALTVEG